MQNSKSDVPFFMYYFPSIEIMSQEQLAYYQKWLIEYKKEIYLDVCGNISYLFVYMYSILEDKDYDEIINQLLRIKNVYGEYAKIDEYCNEWLTDCYVAKREYRKALSYSPKDFNIIKNAGGNIRIDDIVRVSGRLTKFGKSIRESIKDEIVLMYKEIEEEKSINIIDKCTKIIDDFDHMILRGSSSRKYIKTTHYKFNDEKFWAYIPDATRLAENRVRNNMGLPQIGQGWLSETKLYHEIGKAFFSYRITQHAKLPFLGNQHLDIYIHDLKIGLEYQGEQHSKPIDFFGGEKAFRQNIGRDKRKKLLCEQNGVNLVYVYPNYCFESVLSEIIDVCSKTGVIPSITPLKKKDIIDIQNKIDNQHFRYDGPSLESISEENKQDNELDIWLNDHKKRLVNYNEKEVLNFERNYRKILSESKSPFDKHYWLVKLVKLFYKYREHPGFIEKCIEYGIKDLDHYTASIEILDSLSCEAKIIFGPTVVSVTANRQMLEKSLVDVIKILANTYQKFKNFDLAIEICKKAIELGISDNTKKSGFEERIASLEKEKSGFINSTT